ncbi:MAG TPA: formate dehydrogenase accessory sulfurtransferase FdhD [Bryobacteraceae bacterium]
MEETVGVRRVNIQRIGRSAPERVLDQVPVEEPLSISISHWFKDVEQTGSFSVTMRTPGNDRELVAGLLFAEGIVRQPSDLLELRMLGAGPPNEILAALSKEVDFETWRAERIGLLNSSCGVCGKRNREAIAQAAPIECRDRLTISASLVESLPALLSERQRGFQATGGLHAAALCTANGDIEAVFEDIGRHNALDKLIGWAFLHDALPWQDRLVFLTSRGSFELVQKAAAAGAPILATVGGPSSLAIETARDCQMTLIGFVRDARFNIYSGDWRIHSEKR